MGGQACIVYGASECSRDVAVNSVRMLHHETPPAVDHADPRSPARPSAYFAHAQA